jgi:hypothetical protein
VCVGLSGVFAVRDRNWCLHSAYYTHTNVSTTECPYQCDTGFYGHDCISLMSVIVAAFGGAAVFAVVIILLLIGLLVLVILLWRRRKQIESAKVRVVVNFHRDSGCRLHRLVFLCSKQFREPDYYDPMSAPLLNNRQTGAYTEHRFGTFESAGM